MSYIILLSLFLFVVNLIILNKATVIKFFRLMDHPIVNRSIHDKPIPKIVDY